MAGMKSLDALHDRAVGLMRSYLDAEDAERTPMLKDLAEVLADARAHFYNRDGLSDWAGRTYAYRMWVREAYSDANVPSGARTALQAATRWHVGEVLRSRLSAEELEAAGLDPKSPRERNVDARAERATARSLIGPGPEITDAEDVLAVVDIIDVTLRRIPEGVSQGYSAKDRRRVQEALRPILDRLTRAVNDFAAR